MREKKTVKKRERQKYIKPICNLQHFPKPLIEESHCRIMSQFNRDGVEKLCMFVCCGMVGWERLVIEDWDYHPKLLFIYLFI